MRLTKNEKKILHLLLENSKLSDTTIATQLKISSQAVGRIRRDLENKEIIENYKAKLNSGRLGVKVFAFIKMSIVEKSKRKEIEKELSKLKNTIIFVKTMDGDLNYTLTMGFQSIEDMEDFINQETELRKNIAIKEVIPYCQRNVLKNSITDLLRFFIEQSGNKKADFGV